AHFDETIRLLIREGKLTSEEDAFGPNQTATTRCRLAYILSPEARTASTVFPAARPEKPKPSTVVAPLPPPAPPTTAPALPSPAVRLEAIGRLRDEGVRIEREWTERFGPDCFRSGSPEFLKTLFQQV